jgi:hypothetical protein
VLRLFGHAWEWAGFLNYSKSIPAAQKDLSPQNKFTYYFTNDIGGRVVPQGSNEDGFNVSPKGLEDIETGATLTVDSIGSSTLDDFQSTDFPNGLTASEITVDTLTINTSVQFPEVSAAKVDSLGPVRLASISQITATGSNAVVAGSNGDIEGVPDAVTIGALNRWRIEQRLLSQRTGVQTVYVDPINGANITNLNTLLTTQPTSAENRIKSFTAAVNYANAAFSPQEIVEFRLGPGIYSEISTLTFKSITRIRAWSYVGNGSYLNDSADGGTIPFANANFYDPTKQPVFLSRIDSNIAQSPQLLLATVNPLRFVFEQDANIAGVAWWGSMTTMANAGVPDSLWPGTTATAIAASSATAGNWRNSAIADPDNALNYFIRSHAMLTSPLQVSFTGLGSSQS